MIQVKAPGKLYIAGEYAVVTPGYDAIVIAVDKFITVKLNKADSKGFVKSYSNIKMIWSRQGDEIVVEQRDDRFDYIFSAIGIVEKYLSKKGYNLDLYDIEVTSELESEEGLKYGLGSSAAVVVGVVKAILKYYDYKYTKQELFKLSSLASIQISPQTSCGDIASAVYTGLIKYTSFSREAILSRSCVEEIDHLIESDWEYLNIERAEINPAFDIVIGWTKSPASSVNLVTKSMGNTGRDPYFFENFLSQSKLCVEEIFEAYKDSDFDKLKENIEKNRDLLDMYAKHFDIEIERDNLKDLIEIAKSKGYAAKTSGAGGGDCGIAIANGKKEDTELEKAWNDKGIIKLNLNIYEDEDE